MTNFSILYASAAVLVSSAMVALVVTAIWIFNEFRQGEASKYRAAEFIGAKDERPREGPYALAPDSAI